MARVEFERCDFPVTIRRDDAGITIRAGARSSGPNATLPTPATDQVTLPVSDLERLFQYPPASAFTWSTPRGAARLDSVFRIVLELLDSSLGGLAWEQLLSPAGSLISGANPNYPSPPTWTIVRRAHVRPRFETLPLTLPLRLLHMYPRPEHPVGQWVHELFGQRSLQEVARAVVTDVSDNGDAPLSWPTVDVLHVDSLARLGSADALLTSDRPDDFGTLAGFARQTERWQTRLVVLHCESPEEAHTARCFAQGLIDKGGPAVLVAHARDRSEPSTLVSFYRSFYWQLIHDNPLDQIVAISGWQVNPALFAGAGREEALRTSNVGAMLVDLSSRITAGSQRWDAGVVNQVQNMAGESAKSMDDFVNDLSDLRLKWSSLEFDQHERDGLLPLAAEMERLRSRIPAAGRIRFESATTQPTAGPRFVNGSLWSAVDGPLEQVPQDSALLRLGEVYHLGLDIGPKDDEIVTLNATALFEDVFKWTEQDGVWIEFAVTGIDFDIVGDPVREVWLPRNGKTEPVYVAIRPKKAGVAHLRYALYYRQNLIQSFHLAAHVTYPGDLVTPAVSFSPSDLAKALNVSPQSVGTARYLARLDYARTSRLEAVSQKPPRALAITANNLEGRGVLTVKGPGMFRERVSVELDDELRGIVKQVRQALYEISYVTPEGGSQPQYQFGSNQSAAALDARFESAIFRLAQAGYRLFNNLEPDVKKQRAIAGVLSGERKVIQVAPLLRKKVVPWGFVYDRPFDRQPRIVDTQMVAPALCRAPLFASTPAGGAAPGSTASGLPAPVALGAVECETHEQCLLHPARQAERTNRGEAPYEHRSVACPLRFWGFRHVIEAPALQVENEQEASEQHEETTQTATGKKMKLVAGLNATLTNCEDHWKDLLSVSSWADPEYERAQLLARLRDGQIDFIYLFCHARGGEYDELKTDPPFLEFQKKGATPGTIEPQDFADEVLWEHGPLIFLNACGTVGYSPDALSPFLKTLVVGRGAAGVLGTEVPVAEILAGGVARNFIERFVAGARAGDALLDVRRELLKQKNPLGLVYTLFATAELAIARH